MNKSGIQRFALIISALILATPAWSKSETWNARDRKMHEAEGTRNSSDGIVTVSWSNCRTGPALMAANRNWQMQPGSTVTITCKPGWRIRAFRISDQLQNAASLVSETSTYDGNGATGISNYQATRNNIQLRAKQEVEFAHYTVEYVREDILGSNKEEYALSQNEEMTLDRQTSFRGFRR